MNQRGLRGFLSFVVILSAVLAGSATKPANPGSASSEHQRIIDFWTNERVAQAIPRDFIKTGPNQYQLAAQPTKGGPGSNKRPITTTTTTPPSTTTAPSTTTTAISTGAGATTGSSWNGGGNIADTTGKVLFAMGSSYYVCSASVVTDNASDRSIVLTAGHCVYDQATGQFATNWMYIPNYDAKPARLNTSGTFCGSTVHGCWTATALVAHTGFTSQDRFNDAAVLHDFGFAVLESGGKFDSFVDELLGSHTIAYDAYNADTADGVVVDAFGYPAAQKYKGNDLVYCEGPIGFDFRMDNDTYRIACDMTGGSSGGPWLRDFDGAAGGIITSLNSYGYTGDQSMYGPKFDAKTLAVYDAAMAVTMPTTTTSP